MGKDKFISMGFSPNIGLALKTILSESLLEKLGDKDESSLEDLNNTIEQLVNDSVNIKVEELDIDDAIEHLDEEDAEEQIV